MAMYFEDFFQGYSFVTGKRKLSKKQIISFAKEWDYQPFHLNENLAAKTKFEGIIASGWQTLLVAFTLILDTKKIQECSLGSPGLEDVNWLIPVRPDNILTCKVTVVSNRKSKSGDYGIVKILVEIFNQDDNLVANMKAIWMLRVRPVKLTFS